MWANRSGYHAIEIYLILGVGSASVRVVTRVEIG
jgi:hypothetical protein